ncbi:MAG: hypothetical protein WD851_23325 [Pirellulales bacterium]
MSRRFTICAPSLMLAIWTLAIGSAAHAVTTSWNTDFNGTFTSPANWDNGVPESDDTAVFNRGSAVIFPRGSIFEPPPNYVIDLLRVSASGVGFVYVDEPFFPAIPSLTVDNPFVIDTDRGILVQGPSFSPATLNLHLAVNTESATIADAAGTQGTLNVNAHSFNVNGSNSSLDELIIGSSGAGTLNVTSGGQVNLLGTQGNAVLGKHSGSTGVATIDGAGSSWTASHIYLGGSPTSFGGGTGTLSITGGGSVVSGFATIADVSGSTGAAVVTDPGSNWTTAFNIIVGKSGAGTLNITGGGSVVSDSATIANVSGSTGTVVVTGPGSNWSTPSNITVGVSGTGTLTIQNGGLVSSVSSAVASTGAVTVAGDGSTWNNSVFLEVNGNLTIADGGVANVAANSPSGGLIVNGNMTIADGGSVTTSGSGGVIGGTVTVSGAGSNWTIDRELSVGSFGSGTLDVTGGGKVSSGVGRVGSSGGTVCTVNVDGPGSTWTIDGILSVGVSAGAGTLNITGGGKVSNGDARVGAPTGTIDTVTVDGPGSTWTTSGDLTIGFAQIQVSGGASVAVSGGILLIESLGRVAGDSLISGVVVNGGRVEPGLNPGATTGVTTGTLDIDGIYIQSSTGILQIRLGGGTPGTGYDQLQVNGVVALAGGLTVLPANTFEPSVGDAFDILDWDSLSGTFDTLQLPMLTDGLNWDTSQLYTTGVLRVIDIVPGDYNQNGVVDAADYTVWRNTRGSTTNLVADGNGNSAIDAGDYGVWKQNFGRTSGAGSDAVVPEPASLVLALSVLAAASAATARKRCL